MSREATDWAMPAEIARFLRLEPADVETLIKSDGLPATKIPRKTRAVKRVWLRDLHRWLVANTTPKATALADYNTFRADLKKPLARPPQRITHKTMIPEHYLHIILGTMPGAAIGYLAGAAITSWRHRRRAAERRRTEGKYYPWSSAFAD